jgi:hypothetical protein
MPPEYGIRLTNLNGKKTIIRPEHTTVIASGTVAMPSGLNGDGTYGVDIDLPYSNISVDDLGVIVVPHSPNKNVIYTRYLDDSSNVIYTTHYVDSGYNYYNRNDSNGVMTSWSPGNRTANVKSTWNPILGCYPIAFWDKMGATTFSKVRLFGATAYLVRDTIDDTNFGVAGTPSNSGGSAIPSGTIGNIHDGSPLVFHTPPDYTFDGTGWYCGNGGYVMPYTELSASCTVNIDFSSAKVVDQVEVNWGSNLYAGSNGTSTITIALYIGSTWYDVLTVNISGTDVWQSGTNSTYGYWRNVTKIRATLYAHCQSGGGAQSVVCETACGELKAWGSNDTDADENKLIYSIGSSQLVDYLVTMRKYNY